MKPGFGRQGADRLRGTERRPGGERPANPQQIKSVIVKEQMLRRRSCALLVLLAVVLLACAAHGDQPSAEQVTASSSSPDAGSTQPAEETTTTVDGDAGAGGSEEPAQPLDAETEAIRQRIESMNDEELKELLAQQEERLAALQALIANATDDGTADDSALDEGEVEDETGGDDDAAEGEDSASSEMDALVGVLKAFKQRLVASQASTRFGSTYVSYRGIYGHVCVCGLVCMCFLC